ncbi:hypothetical protein ACH5RR_021449 [Cinchona calisaya]|uniref:Uncharacterized protein n=1 Tax=Cinchona calisaya TaxID=153742 RepID=A0ABD2ZKK2_9GENT
MRSNEAVRWHFGPPDEDLVTVREGIEDEEANEESNEDLVTVKEGIEDEEVNEESSNEDEGDDEARTSEIA